MMEDEDIMSQGLLEKAGLVHRRHSPTRRRDPNAPVSEEPEDEEPTLSRVKGRRPVYR